MNSNIIVKYGDVKIEDGVFLTPLQTAKQPSVIYDTTDINDKYTLILYDSKAVSPSGNHNHWLIINIPGNSLRTGDLSEGTILLSYKGPAPPSGSGEHIYTFEIYKQNGDLDKTVMDENERIISFNAIKNKIGIQNLTDVSSIYFISEYTNPNGGFNIKRNKKRKTIKKNRRSKKGKKCKKSKRNKIILLQHHQSLKT
jgi:phosphatidylethanolamine-binding protein (PEBP) family uncharacterized protein